MKPTPSLAHFVWLCTPFEGAHPAARQSRLHGCLGIVALAVLGAERFRASRAARSAMDH